MQQYDQVTGYNMTDTTPQQCNDDAMTPQQQE
jgi:hypothetical protein